MKMLCSANLVYKKMLLLSTMPDWQLQTEHSVGGQAVDRVCLCKLITYLFVDINNTYCVQSCHPQLLGSQGWDVLLNYAGQCVNVCRESGYGQHRAALICTAGSICVQSLCY